MPAPVLGGRPGGEVDVPGPVRAVAAGRAVAAVWINEAGGTTFEVGTAEERCFVKWAPRTAAGLDLAAEADRMVWAGRYVPVPTVLALEQHAAGTLLATSPLRGTSAVDDPWRGDPATAVGAVGAGLRSLHDAAPVGDCPFSWAVEDRVAVAVRRVGSGATAPASWHPEHRGLTAEEALAVLADPPPTDRLVVCHGDACMPNTILDEAGRFSGLVDLGSLGAADPWADLAIATWSTAWNVGDGWEQALLDAYGAALDPVRCAYYRLLWDLT